MENKPMTELEKSRLFTTLDEQTKKLERLEDGMFGSEKWRRPGLVKDVDDLKKWKAKFSLNVAFLSGIGFACWAMIKWLAEGLRDWIAMDVHPKG